MAPIEEGISFSAGGDPLIRTKGRVSGSTRAFHLLVPTPTDFTKPSTRLKSEETSSVTVGAETEYYGRPTELGCPSQLGSVPARMGAQRPGE